MRELWEENSLFLCYKLSMRAIDTLSLLLKNAGLSDDDINMLLAQFLEEEAKDFVECMETINEETYYS